MPEPAGDAGLAGSGMLRKLPGKRDSQRVMQACKWCRVCCWCWRAFHPATVCTRILYDRMVAKVDSGILNCQARPGRFGLWKRFKAG